MELEIDVRQHIELALAYLEVKSFSPTPAGQKAPSGFVKVPGFSKYAIDQNAEVYSFRKKGKLQAWRSSVSKPYLRVDLVDDEGKYRKPYLHDIMLASFCGPKKVGQMVRHLDDNPSNNTLANLVYGTATENKSDAIRNGRHLSSTTNESRREIIEARKMGATLKDIATRYRLSSRTVSKILSGSMHEEQH